MKIYNLNAFRMLSQGRDSNPRSLLSKQSLRRCKLASLSLCICGACVTMSLRAMPTALDCILLYQHVKDPGGCTVATRVHSYIPYGIGAPKLVGNRGLEPLSLRVMPASPASLITDAACCYHSQRHFITGFLPLVVCKR